MLAPTAPQNEATVAGHILLVVEDGSDLANQILAARPALAGRLATHGLGDPEPDLKSARLLVFAIGRAAAVAHAESIRRLARLAALHWTPVLNPPDALIRPLEAAAASGEGEVKRAFVLRGEVVNAELAAVFGDPDDWRGRLSNLLTVQAQMLRDVLAADRAYFQAAPEAVSVIAAACRGQGLDFACVDFVSRPDGSAEIVAARPFRGLEDSTFHMAARRRGTAFRAERVLSRFGEALEAALERELGSPLSVAA